MTERVKIVTEKAETLADFVMKLGNIANAKGKANDLDKDAKEMLQELNEHAESVNDLSAEKFNQMISSVDAIIDFMNILMKHLEDEQKNTDAADPSEVIPDCGCDDYTPNKELVHEEPGSDDNQHVCKDGNQMLLIDPISIADGLRQMIDEMDRIYAGYSRVVGTEVHIDQEIEMHLDRLNDKIEMAVLWLERLPDDMITKINPNISDYRKFLKKTLQGVTKNRYAIMQATSYYEQYENG